MALFKLISVWKIEAPLPPVWDSIYHFEDWPAWWKGVEQVEILEPGDSNRVGLHSRQIWKSKLPYKLRFETTVSRMEPMSLIEVQSAGELEGTGLMRFARDGSTTIFQVDWTVATTKPWMTIMTPILRPAFAWNHNTIMDWGAACLAKKIGAKAISTSTQGVL
jgi:uncharacterized membrane protein